MNSNRPGGSGSNSPSTGKAPLPRSPRAALEPERVPPPTRPSRRARHPVIVVGNAIFTLLVVISVAVGAGLFVGKQRFDAPGPLAEDKVVNIPARPRHSRYCRSAAARRRDRSALGVHGRRDGAQGARRTQVRRISVQQAVPASPTWSKPSSKARWCSTPSPSRRV